ncbi:unnamed protein product [Paramecium pentaurelia]|uniref:Transmembrane protein n=1 Tax=Paramecium pentaurelia TaxID=43138 RepID=A0A8S1VLX1_9CILI|nr:unnamed protein product [Paramecium pentaurelia]
MFKYQKREAQFCKNTSKSLFTKLDYFAQRPQFQVLKKTSFSTAFGYLLTIMLSTICVFYLYIQMDELTKQSNPQVIISDNQPLNTPVIYLSRSNFTFVISVSNALLQSFDKNLKYYNLTINQCHRKRSYDEENSRSNVSLECFNYKIEPCDLEKHFVTDFQKTYFQKFKLSTMYCLNPEQWDQRPIQLQGHSQSDNFQFVTINLNLCKNSTNYKECSPIEEIQKGLVSSYYAIYLSDVLIKMQNPGRPYDDVITIQNTQFSYAKSQQMHSLFKIVNTETDVGLINKDVLIDETILQSATKEYSESYNGYYLANNLLYLEQRETIYYRSYIKLQTILGNVGGLWQIISLVISAIFGPVLFTYMNLSLVSKFFRIENNKSKNQFDKQILNDDEIKEMNMIGSDQQTKNLSIIQNSNQTKLKQYLKKKKNPISISFKDALLMYLGCLGNNQKIYRFAIQKIMMKLDVAYIIKKLHEIDKLKSILMTNEQVKLFNYIPKPLIPSDIFDIGFKKQYNPNTSSNQAESISIFEEEKTEIQKLEDSFHAYQKIRQKENPSNLDQVIIEQMDEEIKAFFDCMSKKQSGLMYPLSPRFDSIPQSQREEENLIINQEPQAGKVLTRKK